MLLLDENESAESTQNTMASGNFVPDASIFKKYKPKSQCFPDLMSNSNIWAFLLSTVNDIKQLETTPKVSNLTQVQSQAILRLQNHPDLDKKASDKGGNVVLMTKLNDEKIVVNILLYKEWYVRISEVQTTKFKTEFLNIISSAHQKGLIDQDLYNYLNVRNQRLATFYALPKIHKHSSSPPGRPILSGIGSLTKNASRFVDSSCHMCSPPPFLLTLVTPWTYSIKLRIWSCLQMHCS